jgi:dTDP-glucose pyrophosphorylase
VKGVLVAGGLGERTVRPAWRSPRLLWPSVERPPVDQAIEAFARAGFEEVAVVVGHSDDVLWHYLDDSARYGIAVYCFHNVHYLRGSATAIYAAQAFVGGEPFVMSLSGHPVTANMLLSLRAGACGTHAVSICRQIRQRKDGHGAVKVCLDDQGCVCRIGKRLRHWHALSTGAFLFQPDVFEYVAELLLRGDGDCSISSLLRVMIAGGKAPYGCSVSPMWEGVRGGDEFPVWTAPMLSVRMVVEQLAA